MVLADGLGVQCRLALVTRFLRVHESELVGRVGRVKGEHGHVWEQFRLFGISRHLRRRG